MKRTLAVAQMCLVAAITIIALIVPAHAAVQVNDRTEIAISVFVPCAAGGAGEVVDLAGPLHTLVSFTINGHNVSGYMHFQPQEIVGVGETTGVKYQATGITQESFKGPFQNGQILFTFVNNFRIIGQGPGNNYLVHENEHFIINADGTVTVFHDNFSIVCQ
jgi:hypothetical protein